MARDRRYRNGRQATIATWAGIATAILAGAGVVAGTALATAGHSGAQTAAPAARYASEGTRLSLALSDWVGAPKGSYAELAGLPQVVETYVSYLRRKLDRLGPPLIHTRRGQGYLLRCPPPLT